MSVALYRKYRPKTFDEITGQSAIVQTLRNQVKTNMIGHAYLFYGLRGSGKTSIARILAKAVNCEHTVNGNPCGQCEHCNFKNNVNPDIIEIDAASNNGVDNIRQLIDEVNYKPTNTKYKVYIIDEVHMLSNSAFNALLKTIEEPPEHAIFILATTEFNKVPETIKSRCQIYTFKYISEEEIVNGLKTILQKENIDYFDDDCLHFIAKKGDGSMRDAISILDQCITNANGKVTIENLYDLFGDLNEKIIINLTENINKSNIVDALNILREQYRNGCDLYSMFNDLYHYYFNMIANNFDNNSSIVFERYARILGETMSQMEHSTQKITLAEIAFVKMCRPEMENDYNSVVQRMNNLEKELSLIKSDGPVLQDFQKEQEEIDENVILYYNSTCNHQLIIL